MRRNSPPLLVFKGACSAGEPSYFKTLAGAFHYSSEQKARTPVFRTDFCAFDCCLRKHNTFLAAWVDLSEIERHCKSSGGRCSFYHRQNVQLRGKKGNRWVTNLAEAYPPELVRGLGRLLSQALHVRKMQKWNAAFMAS